MSVYVLATLDTKGAETEYLCAQLRGMSVEVRVIDAGCLGTPMFTGDVSREEVFAAAGQDHTTLAAAGDRGAAITAAAEGAAAILARLHAQGKVTGAIGLGGSAGTTIAASALRTLPIGLPKILISTMASGQIRHYIGDKDIFMLNSVVDIVGVNRISRMVISQAAAAMAGMIRLSTRPASDSDRPLVAATMFGVTTPCVQQARSTLEKAGYEVIVFHATGAGGQAMESLIAQGLLAGVLDITTTEVADELIGGVLSAGPHRLWAAAVQGVPQVVSVGATDMVNFHAIDTVPPKFARRTLYQHNASVTLMRTSESENERIGAFIGKQLAAATGPVAVMLPTQGVSALDRSGQPFDDPTARQALFKSLRTSATGVQIIERDEHINDPSFAQAAAEKLIELMALKKT